MFAATLGPAAPELPQGWRHHPPSGERRRGGALAVAAEPLPPSERPGACGGRAGRARRGMGGGQHWGLEVDAVAPCGV